MLNTILVTVLLAAIARDEGNDYYPSNFVLFEIPLYKRDLVPNTPVPHPQKWEYHAQFAGKWGSKAYGWGITVSDGGLWSAAFMDIINKNPILSNLLRDMISHKSKIQPYNPGDEET